MKWTLLFINTTLLLVSTKSMGTWSLVDHPWCMVFKGVELNWSGHVPCWVRQNGDSRPHWREWAKFMAFFAHSAPAIPGLACCSPTIAGFPVRGPQNPNLSVHPLVSLPPPSITQMDLLNTPSSVFAHNLFCTWQSDNKLSWTGVFLLPSQDSIFSRKSSWCIPNLAKMTEI